MPKCTEEIISFSKVGRRQVQAAFVLEEFDDAASPLHGALMAFIER